MKLTRDWIQEQDRADEKYMTMTNSLNEKMGQVTIGKPFDIKDKEQPEPHKCRFCNREIKAENYFGMWFFMEECDCEGANEYFLKYDAEHSKIVEECLKLRQKLRAQRHIEQLVKSSNLGRRFKDRTFSTFKQTEENKQALNKAYEYTISFKEKSKEGKGLFLTGSVGTGKTHLAASIANHLMREESVPVKFGNITSLIGEIKNTYNGDSEITESDVIRKLSSVDLLIIDDLGKENGTSWTNSIIYTVINNRYEDYKPTIITTNLSIKELEKSVGDATVSRILEMCGGIKMEGMDNRKTRLV